MEMNMPLETSLDSAIFTDPGTLAVVFGMRNFNVDQTVRVSITAEAIQKLGGGGNPIDVVRAHRGPLERLASEKFDKQGGGTNVTVLEGDLV